MDKDETVSNRQNVGKYSDSIVQITKLYGKNQTYLENKIDSFVDGYAIENSAEKVCVSGSDGYWTLYVTQGTLSTNNEIGFNVRKYYFPKFISDSKNYCPIVLYKMNNHTYYRRIYIDDKKWFKCITVSNKTNKNLLASGADSRWTIFACKKMIEVHSVMCKIKSK